MPMIERARNGQFHQSALALSLYCTSHSKKSLHNSVEAPFGYIHLANDKVFGIGFFKRADGKAFVSVVPIDFDADQIVEFVQRATSTLGLDGGYVRFLTFPQYKELLIKGYLPAKESPWSADSPEEDETLNSAVIRASSFYDRKLKIKYVRMHHNRGLHFLERNGLGFRLEPLLGKTRPAYELIRHQLDSLKQHGKSVTSSPEDHKGLIKRSILTLDSTHAYIGYISNDVGQVPISVFIASDVGNSTCAVYLGASLRDIKVLHEHSMVNDETGFTALSTFAYVEAFKKIIELGFDTLDLGGSEHSSLNQWKRYVGAEQRPSYWAFTTGS